MEIQTYTRRENARRAAIKAGISKEMIKLTVHKTSTKVRFGYKSLDGAVTAPKLIRTLKQKEKTPPKEQNGIRPPAAGGLCAAVWDYLDTYPASSREHIREVAESNGWNTNNALCELYTWRKFHGLTRANKKG